MESNEKKSPEWKQAKDEKWKKGAQTKYCNQKNDHNEIGIIN